MLFKFNFKVQKISLHGNQKLESHKIFVLLTDTYDTMMIKSTSEIKVSDYGLSRSSETFEMETCVTFWKLGGSKEP